METGSGGMCEVYHVLSGKSSREASRYPNFLKILLILRDIGDDIRATRDRQQGRLRAMPLQRTPNSGLYIRRGGNETVRQDLVRDAAGNTENIRLPRRHG